MKKVLSIMVVLALLLSVVPVLGASAEGATTWTKVASLADIGADDTFAITITIGETTYVLPVVQSSKAAESTAIPEDVACTVDGNTLTITDTRYNCGWNLVSTTGGYYIKSGNLYLFAANSNNGIRIWEKNPDATFVWNIVDCGLLGASDGSSIRTLCVDGTIAAGAQWGLYPIAADGRANSKVRDNVLGLWKLNPSHTCEDVDPLDHNCDTCGKTLSVCEDADPLDHNCDLCGDPLSECEDAANDGDHNCDICNAADVSQCIDADGNKRCDDCDAALCAGEHTDVNPKDHACDVCGVPTSECEDKDPLDHNCDICGDPLSECEDAEGDGDHNCDICGAENISQCADATGDNDHLCDECGAADITDHKWSDATIEAPKTCDECGLTEGDPLPLSPTPEGNHWIKVEDLSDIGEGEKLAITITIDSVTYIFPNAAVSNSASAPNLDLQGTISEDGRFLTSEGKPNGINWTVVPTEGGYYIKSGSNYLWVAAGDTGLRITDTDAPTVWKIYDCKLLGSQDENGNCRVMCIRDGLWKSFKTYDNTETGAAHSTVRNNVLGLWKYVPVNNDEQPEPPAQTGDFSLAGVIAVMVVSTLGLAVLLPKKKAF